MYDDFVTIPSYTIPVNKYFSTYNFTPDFAYTTALEIIEKSIANEKEDELFYNYLLSVANPNDQEWITSIRNDEIKHNKMLREIYWQLTGQELSSDNEVPFSTPANYCDGLRKALKGEIGAVERYRKVLYGFESLVYRNMITEIITDELKHTSMWNYLITMNCK